MTFGTWGWYTSVYADDVYLLVEVYILYRKNTEASAVISKEASQAVSADRTKCVYMSCELNTGQNYNIKIGSKYCENIVKFKHLWATVTNQNYICEQTNSKVN